MAGIKESGRRGRLLTPPFDPISHAAYFNKLVLFVLLITIIIPVRLPAGTGTVAATWVVIALFLYLYFLRQTYAGFVSFPLKLLAPFLIFTLFASFSLDAAPDRVLGVKKLILWCLGVSVMIIVRGMISSSKDRSAFLRQLFLFSFLVGGVGFSIITIALVAGTDKVFDFLLFEVMPYIRSEENWMFSVSKSLSWHPLLNWTVMDGVMFRNISIFLSPIVCAAFFGLLAPIALSLYLNTRRSWYFFVFLFMLVNIILTMTRGAWVALFFALGFVFVKCKGTTRKVWVFIFIIILAATALSFGPYSKRIGKTFEEKSSASTRLLFLQRGIEIAKANSPLGVGFANYERIVDSPIHEYPHNQYIELWAETGLGGLLAYLMVLGYVFRRNYKRIPSALTAYDKALYIGFVGSIIFFVVYSIFEDLLASPPVILTFMLILGLAEAGLFLKAHSTR